MLDLLWTLKCSEVPSGQIPMVIRKRCHRPRAHCFGFHPVEVFSMVKNSSNYIFEPWECNCTCGIAEELGRAVEEDDNDKVTHDPPNMHQTAVVVRAAPFNAPHTAGNIGHCNLPRSRPER